MHKLLCTIHTASRAQPPHVFQYIAIGHKSYDLQIFDVIDSNQIYIEYFQKSNLRPFSMNNFDRDLPTPIDFECLHLTTEYGLDKNNGTTLLIDLNKFEWTNLDLHLNVLLSTQYMRIMHRSLLSGDVEDLT